MKRSLSYSILAACLVGAALHSQPINPVTPGVVSERLNSELPGWLRLTGEERMRFESLSGVGFKDVQDTYLLNRLHFGADIRPMRMVQFIVEIQDARVFGQNTLPAPASQKDALDFRLGFLKIGSDESPATLRVGRQMLYFGEGRVLADPNWSNVGRTFDAVQLTLRRGPARLYLFGGSVTKADPVDWDLPVPHSRLYGAYGSVRPRKLAITIEPYLLIRHDRGLKSEAGALGILDSRTTGLRLLGNLPFGVDYGAEAAGQMGWSAGDRVKAWAGHWVVGQTLPYPRWKPRYFVELNKASGDANPRDGVRGGFDPLYPSTHDKLGLTDLFTWTNVVHFRTGAGLALAPKVTVGAAYNSYWLANQRDGLYVGGKIVARSADGSAGKHIGRQADVQAAFNLTKTTQVNAGYGRLFPGEFLLHATGGVPYNLVFCNVAQRF